MNTLRLIRFIILILYEISNVLMVHYLCLSWRGKGTDADDDDNQNTTAENDVAVMTISIGHDDSTLPQV